MSEVEKLAKYLKDTNTIDFHVTTAYSLGLTDKQPTAEEIAGEINRVDKWLSNPVNNLTSRIEKHIHLKEDTIMCLETRSKITDTESREVRYLKEDIKLFRKAIDMIKELNTK